MKKLIIPISTLLVTGLSYAQSSPSTTENYIYTKTYLSDPALSTPKTSETVQYFDGLGRSKQIVNVKASPAGKDIVTPVVYDEFGRQTRDYLPVPQSGTQNGQIYTQTPGLVSFPVADATNIYNGEKTYSEKILENSPLDRILQQKQVGNDWNTKPINMGYDANTTADAVKKYTITTTWVDGASSSVLSQSSDYGAAQLYKNTITDEDGNTTIEFKNGQEQTILVRKNDGNSNVDTYYVYNEYDQLAFVIPPLAVVSPSLDQTTLDNLCYQYRYDGRNRLVEKKLPGKGWEYMVYDKADRLILTQDANLKELNRWLITKYDMFGRAAYTGILTTGGTRAGRQSEIENIVITEARNPTGFTGNGITVFYTNNYFMGEIPIILSVNYYDTYPEEIPVVPLQILSQPVLQEASNLTINTKGLAVASYIKNIEDDNWTKNYTYYDTKGRVIGTHSINYLGGYTKTESELDFAGAVKQSKTYHKRLNSDTEKVITETFEYDHQNRLLVHKHKVDNNTEEILAQNTYNELSQLQTKKVGGISISSSLQTINYAYNIRGWMTKINDPANLNGKLFGYEIKYNNPVNASVSSGRFNGNIAEIDWSASNDGVIKRYSYQYDTLNRLLKGIYSEPNSSVAQNNYFNEELTYDINGNITTLKRFSKPVFGGTTAEKIDDLIYNYQNSNASNRLSRITLPSGIVNNSTGYDALLGTMTYDVNGNMISHPDKNINSILYNFLNLPNSIIIGSGIRAFQSKYIYKADGTKLKKTNTSSLASSTFVDYLDGFQYEGVVDLCLGCPLPVPVLQFVPTSEGYYDFVQNKYIYNYVDHLGNIRVSYMDNGSGATIIEENNYYPFGLKHQGDTSIGNPAYNYKYNSKELQQETGMYDYGARFYMPDLGRWGVIDPKAELMRRWSSYNYAFDNPIRFIDPDGRAPVDDHFNKFGRYIGTDNKKTNNIIVHTESGAKKLSQVDQNKGTKLSGLDYSKKGTITAVSKVLAHYAGEKGIGGYVGVGTYSKGDAHTNGRGNIFFNTTALKGGDYDNAYNIRSTLNHEGGKFGHKNENIPSNQYTFVDHAKVYLNEAMNPDFGKTTESYRAGQAAAFGLRVLNAVDKESKYGTNLMNMIDTYNEKNTGSVYINLYSGGSTLPTITPQVENTYYDPVPYEDIKQPQD